MTHKIALCCALLIFAQNLLHGQTTESDQSHAFIKARTLLNNGKWNRGLKVLEELKYREADAPHVWALSGRLHFVMENYSQAKSDLLRAIELDDKCAIALLGMAEYLTEREDKDRAYYFIERAFFYNEEFHLYEPIVILKSKLHMERNEEGHAEELLKAVANSELCTQGIINELAFLYIHQGREEKAVDALLKCIDLFGNTVVTYNNIGQSLNVMGKPDLALTYLEKALSREPANPHVLNNLGYSYYLKGDYESALELANISLDYDDSDFPVSNQLRSMLLMEKGYCSRACRIIKDIPTVSRPSGGEISTIPEDEMACECK